MDTAPRIVVAGTGGDAGKTLLSLALLRHLVNTDRRPAAFKKGPDYIDAAWLGLAAGQDAARNLDAFLMSSGAIRGSFARNARGAACSVVEGNRGLYDGLTAGGAFSTAELAKLLEAPVVLVLPVTKVTRTAAAVVLGCQRMDPEVRIAGVVLNRIGSKRQEALIREAVEQSCNVPVLGALPRRPGPPLLPDRHLGLVTPGDHFDPERALAEVAVFVSEHVDLEAILAIAAAAPAPSWSTGEVRAEAAETASRVRIGVFRDEAFSFYYPENLEALERAGAELITISPLRGEALPAVDALYLGGGFPEVHAAALSANQGLARQVREQAEHGLPIYAECGGLIYLSRSVRTEGRDHPMAGALPIRTAVEPKPQGHGYAEVVVDRDNPFFPVGTELRGHEFHYSRVIEDGGVGSAFKLLRGAGALAGRDGLYSLNVFASYVHLHSLGENIWAESLVNSARSASGVGPRSSGLTGRPSYRKKRSKNAVQYRET